MRDIGYLKGIDREHKPARADDDWLALKSYYDDQARERTIGDLATLGVGLAENDRPIEVLMVQRIVNRLAMVYSKPPVRWLKRNRRRLAESNAEHKAMVDVLMRAQYDLAWKRVDALRTLMRQVVIRFYPSDARGSVVMRIFEPYNVIREPDPSAGDMIENDRQFALLLAKTGQRETWEHWRREGERWRVQVVNQQGDKEELADDQPFGATDLVSPYPVLPVQIVYDELPQGRPWLPPRASRIANQRAVNAIANDLWSLITFQAHSREVIKTDDPASAPTVTGHGGKYKLERDDTYEMVTPNPKIRECQEVLDYLAMLWLLGEDMPLSDFDKSTQVLTGAALLVQERALNARREGQVPLALEDERLAWRKLRAIHNLHTAANRSGTWDLPALAEDTDLEVEIAEVTQPIDAEQLQNAMFRDISGGAASIIDYIQARDSVSRKVAIETYERVKEDMLAYPPGQLAPAPGPQTAAIGEDTEEPEMPTEREGAAEMMGTASVVDGLQRAGAEAKSQAQA